MLSNKPAIRNLVEICAQKGIENVIISPGSRNAPLVISFSEHGQFTCLSIPDERVAGFFALGIAQQIRKPVIITCTSGTASLNFAPAIAEAFYQKIPLLVLTADRPVEWIHQGEGQSIQQRNVFANYVKRSYELPQEVKDKDGLWSTNRIICEAIDQTTLGSAGPVHINIPFQEPLYEVADYQDIPLPKIINSFAVEKNIPNNQLAVLAKEWHQADKKLILVGLLPLKPVAGNSFKESPALQYLLKEISKDPSVTVLTETTANLYHTNFINNFDSLLSTIKASENKDFQPDLLLTLGGSFVSKRIKLWLRKNAPKAHWHIEEKEYYIDTFQALTQAIPMQPSTFFKQFQSFLENANLSSPQPPPEGEKTVELLQSSAIKKNYQQVWLDRLKEVQKKQIAYLKNTQWSDLKAFELILPALPQNTNLHLGNSTPVRYTQLFQLRKDIICNSNRGVAGIDGSTSTAAGAAFITKKPTTIITGDISFFYDSNAFWHHHLVPNFRIILINNSGGNIFRFIKGPDKTKQLSDFFEAHHERSAEYIAKTFNLNYFVAANEKELQSRLIDFYKTQKNQRPAILEVKTPRKESAEIWREYYDYLSS